MIVAPWSRMLRISVAHCQAPCHGVGWSRPAHGQTVCQGTVLRTNCSRIGTWPWGIMALEAAFMTKFHADCRCAATPDQAAMADEAPRSGRGCRCTSCALAARHVNATVAETRGMLHVLGAWCGPAVGPCLSQRPIWF